MPGNTSVSQSSVSVFATLFVLDTQKEKEKKKKKKRNIAQNTESITLNRELKTKKSHDSSTLHDFQQRRVATSN